jgi:hypothetical protein
VWLISITDDCLSIFLIDFLLKKAVKINLQLEQTNDKIAGMVHFRSRVSLVIFAFSFGKTQK